MKSQHRRATLANLVCSLIEHSRIRTTIAKAKVARRYADKMITLAKKGTLHHRRQAIAFLRHKLPSRSSLRNSETQHGDRNGGYTRIVRIGRLRRSRNVPVHSRNGYLRRITIRWPMRTMRV